MGTHVAGYTSQYPTAFQNTMAQPDFEHTEMTTNAFTNQNLQNNFDYAEQCGLTEHNLIMSTKKLLTN